MKGQVHVPILEALRREANGSEAGSDMERVQRQASRAPGNENRYKIEDGFLSKASTTQLKHHRHRHVQVQAFRRYPLRCHCARRRHRSVLSSSVVPG